jgi:hypothetical protein
VPHAEILVVLATPIDLVGVVTWGLIGGGVGLVVVGVRQLAGMPLPVKGGKMPSARPSALKSFLSIIAGMILIGLVVEWRLDPLKLGSDKRSQDSAPRTDSQGTQGQTIASNLLPRDRPPDFKPTPKTERYLAAISPFVEEARRTYPAVRDRILAGLPGGQAFYVTVHLWEGGRCERVRMQVERLANGRIYGRLSGDYGAIFTPGYRTGDRYELAEDELIDWVLYKRVNSPEGEVIQYEGNALYEAYRDKRIAKETTPEDLRREEMLAELPKEEADRARLLGEMALYMRHAHDTYPAARKRFLAGLPRGYEFYALVSLGEGRKTQDVYVKVNRIENHRMYGQIWCEKGQEVLGGYRRGEAYDFPEPAFLDWAIIRPDGTTEGNVVGSFLEHRTGFTRPR